MASAVVAAAAQVELINHIALLAEFAAVLVGIADIATEVADADVDQDFRPAPLPWCRQRTPR
jgi:hypothetical protein